MPGWETGSNEGELNGTTPVELVGSPATGDKRLIRHISVVNRDTAAVVFNLQKVTGAGTVVLDSVELQPGSRADYEDLCLDDDDESYEGFLDGAVATDEPTFDAMFGDETP